MKKFKYLTPQIVVASCLFSASALCAQTYIDEQFDYPDGMLSTPWSISYGGSGEQGTAVIDVEAATTYNSYAPTGKEVYVSRPNTGTAGAPVIVLSTATSSPVTNDWTVTSGDIVQFSFDLATTSYSSGGSAPMLLQGNNNNILGVRMLGTGPDTGKFQVMTTGSTGSFTDLLDGGNPIAANENTWYNFAFEATIGSTVGPALQNYHLTITEMGASNTIVYSGDLSLTTTASIGGVGRVNFNTVGVVDMKFADVQLAAVPEPEHSAALLMSVAGLAWLARKRFSRKNRG